MKLSDFLEAVNAMYIPGLVKFYAGMKPDPWQAAHDKLEVSLLTKDPQIIADATKTTFNELKRLRDAYAQGVQTKPQPEPYEAFFNPSIADNFENQIEACRVCGSKKDLVTMSTGAKSSELMIVCKTHKPK